MYFSKIQLRSDATRATAFWSVLRTNEYDIHRQIWSLFADDRERKRDFLYRREDQKTSPTFYVLSQREPHNQSDLWDIKTKAYAPVLRPGLHLSFMLRANPIRSKKADNSKKQQRHDVVMEAKTKLKNQHIPRHEWKPEAQIIWEAGAAWINSRAERAGFAIDQLVIDGYRQQRFNKSGHDVRISTLEYSGILTVKDPELFTATLFHGIGPAKGFGCGLLLVRKI